ncbi:MAG: hypothetical protein K2L48_02675 [Mycoplasmoidaceae bacterium]|nr:hypothetical protein [Mycoplasmoidaceae bacterium]
MTNQVNLAIYKSKNSNLDFQGTKNLIKNEIDQIIEHLQRSTEKLLAFNSLNDLLTSFDFSINKKVLDSNLKDKSISIHELTKDHTEDELNEIKESLLPLMFTYRNLPVKSDIIENYYFGFDTTEIAWTNPVTAQVSFEFYLTKKDNTNEKLATFSFEKISIEDNLSGKRDALTKYIDDLDIVFQEKLPEYESFKDKIVSSISPDSQGRYFVNQELLLQICKKFKLNSLSDNQDFFDNLRSDNIFSIGAHVKFLDESILSENQRKIQFNILFYDSQVTSDSSINSDSSSYIICESEKTYEITLAVESDLILKNAYIQELTLGTFDENLQSLLKIHNFLDNPETKNTIDEASDKAKLLVDCNTAYLVIDYFSQVSSVLIDVVCVSPVFFFLDLGVGAYDLFSAHNAEERYKSLKKSYNEQKDVYDEVVKSDGYLQLDQLFKSNDVNLYQIQKDVHNKMDEFGMLVSSKDSIYDFSIKDPETLLNELKDKYKVYSLEESLEELENNEFK